MKKRLASLVRASRTKSECTDQSWRILSVPALRVGCSVAYALSPIDLIPDFIPVIGHLDDVLILPLLVWLAIRIIPKELIAEHRSGIGKMSV
jgi:uncharacterized membrane protein YkvA (DUF1232 family)